MLHMLHLRTSCYQWDADESACSMQHERDKKQKRPPEEFDRATAIELLEFTLHSVRAYRDSSADKEGRPRDLSDTIRLPRRVWELINETGTNLWLPPDDNSEITLSRDDWDAK